MKTFREWLVEITTDGMIFCDLDETLINAKHTSAMSIFDVIPREGSLKDRMEKGRALRASGYDVLQGHVEHGWIPFKSNGEQFKTIP